MEETQQIYCQLDSRDRKIAADLVVTSPPYPGVAMWEELWGDEIHWELMHQRYLDPVWENINGTPLVCINIGDSVKNVRGEFQLLSNCARIINWFTSNGYHQLPSIIWKKPSNSPNKFMGSGMYPCKAYVTMEHEHILIFRRNGSDKKGNKESAIFWHERNEWYQDLWQIRGAAKAGATAAFPLEIPYRLINMFSNVGDTVYDPFMGRGTTLHAAMISGRNAIGNDLKEGALCDIDAQHRIKERVIKAKMASNELEELEKGYLTPQGLWVRTKQEKEIVLHGITKITHCLINNQEATRTKYVPFDSFNTLALDQMDMFE